MPQYHDIPRIFTGIAEIMSCFLYCEIYMPKASKTRLRFLKLAAGLVVQCGYLTITSNLPLQLWIPCMGIAFAMMCLFLGWNLPLDRLSLLYITMRAILLAEFMASVQWQIYVIFAEMGFGSVWMQIGSMLVIYSLILGLGYLMEKSLNRKSIRAVYTWSEVVAALMITLAVFGFSNLGFLTDMTSLTLARLDIFNTRTLVDLGGLVILYAYESRIVSLQTEREMEALQTGLQTQYENYRNYQDTLELINIKYHDLKHHTLLLRSELDPERKNIHLNELEKELSQFKTRKQTGSPVLDVILAGKSIKMKNSQIQFTYVADGSLLKNIHVTDICTIFGNALDNAIEHVAQIEDPSKRIISMTLARRREFIFIEVSNYCESMPRMQDGVPVTTKKGIGLHGYGVRSMEYTARKYGGTFTMEQKNHFLQVRILIPV